MNYLNNQNLEPKPELDSKSWTQNLHQTYKLFEEPKMNPELKFWTKI